RDNGQRFPEETKFVLELRNTEAQADASRDRIYDSVAKIFVPGAAGGAASNPCTDIGLESIEQVSWWRGRQSAAQCRNTTGCHRAGGRDTSIGHPNAASF